MKIARLAVVLFATAALAPGTGIAQTPAKDDHKHKPGEKHSASEKDHKHKAGEKHSKPEKGHKHKAGEKHHADEKKSGTKPK